jgi:hypothetical protein
MKKKLVLALALGLAATAQAAENYVFVKGPTPQQWQVNYQTASTLGFGTTGRHGLEAIPDLPMVSMLCFGCQDE